jgi:hypothetical protein
MAVVASDVEFNRDIRPARQFQPCAYAIELNHERTSSGMDSSAIGRVSEGACSRRPDAAGRPSQTPTTIRHSRRQWSLRDEDLAGHR